eukprot:gene4635-4967_t
MSEFSHPITVGYWNIRGLAAALRMMVMYRGVTLKADNYDCVENATKDGFDRSDWFNKKPEFKAKHPLMNLPYVMDGDMVVVQTNACFTYLGRRLNLLGKNDLELCQCEQLLCEIMDIRNQLIDYVYPEPRKSAADWFKAACAPGRGLDKLNQWLEKKYEGGSSETVFFVGDEASAPDFHIWEILDQLCAMAKFYKIDSPLTSFSKLSAFHRLFGELPGNKRYFESKLSLLPCNNTSARCFGATPEGGSYVFGQATPWFNSSGLY